MTLLSPLNQTLNQTTEMSQRLSNTTKWLWWLLVLQSCQLWAPAYSVTVRTPPSNPSTIETQAKFFQDFFSVQLSPYKIEFGHVCEDPNTWEQRYEKKDLKNHRDMGKVRWGDKKGGYGEHYWDLNHAGNSGNDGYDGDDGSYHEPSHDNNYEGHHDSSPNYDNDEYDPDKSSYGESERTKRAHPKVKIDRRYQKNNDREDTNNEQSRKKNYKPKEILEAEATHEIDDYVEEDEDEEEYEKPKPKRQQYRKKEDVPKQKERNHVVLVVSEKADSEKPESQYIPKKQETVKYDHVKQPEPQQYVPYEEGAGVRQHRPPEVIQPAVPRLFLEPSTGHVVDRATGQAYLLQPIAVTNKYN